MAGEFTMGARITLEDNFTNPLEEALRITEQFQQTVSQTDGSIGTLENQLGQLGSQFNNASQATQETTSVLDMAAQASQSLTSEQQQLLNETNQLGNEMNQLNNQINPLIGDITQLNGQMDPLAGNLNQTETQAGQLGQEFQDLNIVTGHVTTNIQQLSSTANNAGGNLNHLGDQANGANNSLNNQVGIVGRLKGAFSGLSGIITAVAGSMAVVGGYNWLIDSNAQMEQYQNTLATIMKSSKKAEETLSWAGKFAAKTPFEIPEIVEATTIMTSYGMVAQDTLGQVGDMASVMGKDLMQAVEAIADAQTGELERLKEFGITKKMLEEQAALMGTAPFDKKGSLQDQEALNAALFAIMDDRYAGGMEMQATTFKGMLSNLSDFVSTFGRELGKPLFDLFKVQLTDVLDVMNGFADSGGMDAMIAGIINTVKQIAVVFGTLGNIVGPILQAVFGSVANVISPIIDLIAKSGPVFEGMGKAAQFVSDIIVKSWPVLGVIVESLLISLGLYGAVLLAVKGWTVATTVATSLHTAALFAQRAATLALNIAMMLLKGQFISLFYLLWTSPFMPLVAAMTILIAVGILLYRNWDTIKAAFIDTFQFMAPYLNAGVAAFKTFAAAAGTYLVNTFYETRDAVAQWGASVQASVVGTMDAIGAKFQAAKDWGNGLLDSLGAVGESMRHSFDGVSNTLATLSPLIARLGLMFLGVTGPIGWVIAAAISLGSFLFKLVNNNESVRASLVGAWESIKAGIAPVLAVFGQLASTFGTMLAPAIAEFATAFAVLGPEFQATGQQMAASFAELGPVFAELGAAFAELGATIGPMLATLAPQFAQLFGELASNVSQIAATALPMFLAIVQMVFPAAAEIIMTVIPAIIQIISSIIPIYLQLVTTVIPLLLQIVQAVFPIVLSIIQAVLPVVVTLITTVISVVLNLVTAVLPLILSVVQAVFPIVMQIIMTVIPIIIDIINLLVPVILNIVTSVVPLLLQIVQAVFPVIMSIISAVIPIITALLTFAASIITGVLVPAIQIILQVVTVVFSAITTIISSAMTLVTGIIKTATAILKGDWSAAWSAIKETAVTIMNNILEFFRSIDLVETGKNIIQGLIDGIGSMASAAAAKVKEVAGGIKDAVVGFFDINSPSRVFRNEIGQQLGAGLILGMGDMQGGLVRAAESMAAAAMPNLDAAGPDFSTQLEVATNMSIPTIPTLSTTLDVSTRFDGRQAPTFGASAAGDVNPAGAVRSGGTSSKTITIQNLVDRIEIVQADGEDSGDLINKLIAQLLERLREADELLGDDQGVIL